MKKEPKKDPAPKKLIDRWAEDTPKFRVVKKGDKKTP